MNTLLSCCLFLLQRACPIAPIHRLDEVNDVWCPLTWGALVPDTHGQGGGRGAAAVALEALDVHGQRGGRGEAATAPEATG